MTTTQGGSSAKTKVKKSTGLTTTNDVSMYYENISSKHQMYLPGSGSSLTNQKSLGSKVGLALPSKMSQFQISGQILTTSNRKNLHFKY